MEETFRIKNDKTADWAITQIHESENERDRLIALAEEQIKDLTERIDELKTKCENEFDANKSILNRINLYIKYDKFNNLLDFNKTNSYEACSNTTYEFTKQNISFANLNLALSPLTPRIDTAILPFSNVYIETSLSFSFTFTPPTTTPLTFVVAID